MKSKKIIAAPLGAALSLSMLCMPVYATSSTVSSIVANTQVGDGQREVSSFEIEVSDESIIQNLTAADFDIINNSSTVPFDVNTGSWAEAYQDDGIKLSVSGNKLEMTVNPFCYAGIYKTDWSFQRLDWEVKCLTNDALSFKASDVTTVKTKVLDDTERKTFTYAGLTRQYALYLPKNADGSVKKNVPLVVWNHGGGEYNGNLEDTLVANKGLTGWVDAGYDVAVLQMQVGNENYSYGAAENEDKKKLIDQNNALQAQLIKNLINDGNVNKNQVYVAGASSGGGATMRFLMQYPEIFAGAIACCSMDPIVPVHNQTFAALGREKDPFDTIVSNFEEAFQGNVYTWDESTQSMVSKKIDTQKLLDVPVYYTHAENDPTCNVDSSKAMYKAMENMGDKNNKLSIWSDDEMKAVGISNGMGGTLLHWSWVKVLNDNTDGSPMNWLFKQSKVETVSKSEDKVDDKKESTVNNKVEQSVKTGDNTMIGSYAIIMLLAVGAYTATKKVIR